MIEEQPLELPKPKRNPDDGELDVTPMIDVTFLLLAFFVVVSRMDPQAAVRLPKASFGDSIPEKNCVTIVVKVPDAGEGYHIYLGRSMDDDSKLAPGDPEVLEEQIGDFVEGEFSKYPQKEAVLLKAEGDITTRTVQMVKRGIARSELAKTRDVFAGVEEQQ